MGNWDYIREERTKTEAGDYRVVITKVEEKQSKSGNDMLVVTVQPNNSDLKINHYIVKNEYYNRNMTDLFDSFDIPEGNFNFLEWIGAIGAAKLAEDDKGYLKVRWFINKEKAQSLPEWVGEKPERNTVSTMPRFEDIEDDEELPFI